MNITIEITFFFADFRIELVQNSSSLETYDAVLVIEDSEEIRENLTQVGGNLVAEIINVYANGVHVAELYQVAGYVVDVLDDEIELKLQSPTRMITNYTIQTKHFNTIDFPELQ